jgi:cobalt-zinc-cadmium efflux system membrane fusion protein
MLPITITRSQLISNISREKYFNISIMSKNSFYIKVLAPALITAVVSCSNGGTKTGEKLSEESLPDDIVEMRADQINLAHIETGNVEMREINNTLKVSGLVTVPPQNEATVCAPMGGFIKTINLVPGSSVNKGQTLAVIENQDFIDLQESYLEARNKFKFAEADFARHTELYKNDVYSEQNLQQVTTDYKILKAQVNALQQKLALIGIDYTTLNEDNISRLLPVVAPISGNIKSVNVNSGKYVTPSDVMFEIVNSDKLLLELTLFEKDVDKVAVRQKIKFLINNEQEEHEAVIYQTGKQINADRTYRVYASVLSICKNLLPGMYVNAFIETSVNKVTALPSDAIVSFDDKNYVFIFGRDKTENGYQFTEYTMVEVKAGENDKGYTHVIFPESFDINSAKVVTRGAYNLLSAKKNSGEMAC